MNEVRMKGMKGMKGMNGLLTAKLALAAALLVGCASELPQRTTPDRAVVRPEAGRPFPQAGRREPIDSVILVPGADGKTGSIVVRQGKRETVLGDPYEQTRAASDRALERGQSSETAVKKNFGDALAAAPPPPFSFIVYFRLGRDELTEESRKELDPLLEKIAGRPAPEISLVGHTDRSGPDRVNDALSLNRAERVRELLLRIGVPAERIVATARGEQEPAVPTANGVPELRNRRVEVSVR